MALLLCFSLPTLKVSNIDLFGSGCSNRWIRHEFKRLLFGDFYSPTSCDVEASMRDKAFHFYLSFLVAPKVKETHYEISAQYTYAILNTALLSVFSASMRMDTASLHASLQGGRGQPSLLRARVRRVEDEVQNRRLISMRVRL